jgi:hypothetical protein
MESTKSSVRSLATLAVAGMLAGCAGGASAPQTSSNALPFTAPQMRVAGGAPIDFACKIDHRVSVKPCSINLSFSNPEQTVTTKGPSRGTFTFSDKTCAQSGIATISGSGNTYVAVWGYKSGSCVVVFKDKTKAGKTIGKAALSITNKA